MNKILGSCVLVGMSGMFVCAACGSSTSGGSTRSDDGGVDGGDSGEEGGAAGDAGASEEDSATTTPEASAEDATSAAEAGSEPGVEGGTEGGTPTIDFAVSNVPSDVLSDLPPNDLIFSGSNCGGNSAATLDTDTGDITGCNALEEGTHYVYSEVMQEDGDAVGVFATRSLRINTAFNVTVEGQLPLVIVAGATVDIRGGLIAVPTGPDGIVGGFSGVANMRGAGNGPGGGTVGSTGGGGGGSYCGTGGDGTHGGQGGSPYGNEAIVPLLGGSSGGAGSIWDSGAGGGAMQIIAGESLSVSATGFINVGGAGGGQGGCGGGSGGALLIEAATVNIAGVLAANGGGGGTGSGAIRGQNGLASDQPALGGANAAMEAPGGNGSAGSDEDGSPATEHPTIATVGSGGGGGAGRIRINTLSGEATISGTISPAPSTGCATEGSLD